jgi:uncharacterized membrane protein
MLRFAALYGLTAVLFVAVDLLWLAVVARSFYRDGLGSLLSDRPNLVAAVAFYALYVVGLVVFAAARGVSAGDWRLAFAYGALFGLCAYGTYDLTNLATLAGFPLRLALVDMAWGTVLSGTAAAVAAAILRN